MATVNKKEKTDEFKNSIPEEGITVYKVVQVKNSKYYPLYKYVMTPFKEGMNEATIGEKIKTSITNFEEEDTYQAGFHFWLNKKDAEECVKILHYRKNLKIIECIIKKEWVTATGMYHIISETGKTIVTDKAILPEYEE